MKDFDCRLRYIRTDPSRLQQKLCTSSTDQPSPGGVGRCRAGDGRSAVSSTVDTECERTTTLLLAVPKACVVAVRFGELIGEIQVGTTIALPVVLCTGQWEAQGTTVRDTQFVGHVRIVLEHSCSVESSWELVQVTCQVALNGRLGSG